MSDTKRDIFARLQSLFALVAMVIALSFLSDSFLTRDNGLNILRQISGIDPCPVGEDNGVLDCVLELPHVAGP